MDRTQKIFFAIALAGLVLLGALWAYDRLHVDDVPQLEIPEQTQTHKIQTTDATVQLGEQTFRTAVAEKPADRQRGLSGSEPLAADEAMLFIFPNNDTWGIWMKDMNYPIDIIWLDEDYTVVSVKENADPSSYPETFEPEEPARYVLEIPAGAAKTHGIAPGAQATVTMQEGA